jgi:hypothetical protein
LVMAGLTFAWKKKIWKNIHWYSPLGLPP